MSAAKEFMDLLDAQPIQKADIAYILRSKNEYEMGCRAIYAYGLIRDGWAGMAELAIGENTHEEMYYIANVEYDCISRVHIITSPFHQYRTFLTALKVLPAYGIAFSVSTGHIGYTPLEEELKKIELYQQKGDVASYEEGIEWLSRK